MSASAALPPLSDFYRQYRQRAVETVRRIVGDRDEAEDVVQEIFSKLYLRGVRFDGKAAYSTWLHRVLVNSSINCLRARKRRNKLICDPSASEDPEAHFLDDERHQLLLRCLGTLSYQHQQVLTLRELRGFSYPEIAQLLHLPEGTVKSALNRGRARLMEAMAREGVAA